MGFSFAAAWSMNPLPRAVAGVTLPVESAQPTLVAQIAMMAVDISWFLIFMRASFWRKGKMDSAGVGAYFRVRG
jgi:hypothetical protein